MTEQMYERVGSREVPITAEYDAVIYGAGLKGVALAAISAHRGKKVLLVERFTHPTDECFEGRIGKEGSMPALLKRLLDMAAEMGGCGRMTAADGSVRFSIHPEIYKAAAIQLLEDAGVTVLLHTYVSEVGETDGKKIVVTENCDGRRAFAAREYRDTCAFRREIPQTCEIAFAVDHVDLKRIPADRICDDAGDGGEYRCFTLRHRGNTYRCTSLHADQISFCVAEVKTEPDPDPACVRIGAVKRALQREALRICDAFKKDIPGFEEAFVGWYKYDSEPAWKLENAAEVWNAAEEER